MSDTGQRAVPNLKPCGRWRRFRGVACTVCVLALLMALTLWSMRPQWDTFVSRPTHSSPAYQLVVQVPVGWECREESDAPDCTLLRMHRKTLVGLAQWWQQHVLHTDVTQDAEEQNTINLTYSQVADSNNDADYYRFLVEGMLESSTSTCRTYEHALGPALERTYGQGAAHDYVTRIVVRQHPRGQRLEVIAGLSGANVKLSRTHPEWEQTVRSLRVVQK